ncbi:hypothetical protein KAH37_05245 [bacterium]|nr:hypothetical protein [bacterium]
MSIPLHSLVINIDRPTLERHLPTPFLWRGSFFSGSKAHAVISPDVTPPKKLKECLVIDLDFVESDDVALSLLADNILFYEAEWSGKFTMLATAVSNIFIWNKSGFEPIKQKYIMQPQEVFTR